MEFLDKAKVAELRIQDYYRRKDMETKNRGSTIEQLPIPTSKKPIVKRTKGVSQPLGSVLFGFVFIFFNQI